MTDSSNDAGGLLSTMWGSVKLHFEERSRSPFAGAFLLAWAAVNWQQLLILAFSKLSIEQRIQNAVLSLDSHSTVLKPLGLAFLFAVAYYFAATIFIAISEFYRIGSGWVERKIQRREWVPAPRFAEFKEKYLGRIDHLTKLAADNIEEIREANSEASKARLELERIKSDFSAAQNALEQERIRANSLITEKGQFEVQADEMRKEIERISNVKHEIQSYVFPAENLLRDKSDLLRNLAGVVGRVVRGRTSTNLLADISYPILDERIQGDLEIAEKTMLDIAKSLDKGRENLSLAMKV